MGGRLEHEQIELVLACIGCALREDILPTIERLARDGRWNSIVATLPVGAHTPAYPGIFGHTCALFRGRSGTFRDAHR